MKKAILFSLLALTAVSIADLQAASPAAGKTPATAEPAQQEVTYAELGKYIGTRVVVHTKLNTTRIGVLVKHSATEVDLKLDSGAQLTIIADTIKRVTVPALPAEAPYQKPSASSAEKN